MSYSTKHILLVEDERISRFVTQLLLELLDCRVDLAHDGKIAVQLACAQRYDMILMDIGLPKLDGITACKAIKSYQAKQSDLKPTPIVAITANTDTSQLDKYLQAGMKAILFKPVTKQQIINLLDKLD